MKPSQTANANNKNWVIYSLSGNILKLPVAIKPQAKKSQILGIVNGRLKIAIAATPVDGKANKELINFMAQLLAIKKQEVIIASGLTAQLKLLHLPATVQHYLEQILALHQL